MSEWFREAFSGHYSGLYAHRSDAEAEDAVRLILETTALQPGNGVAVLDAPCGAGRHARAFARAGCRVVATDLSDPLLRQGQQAASGAGGMCYVRSDIRKLPVRPGGFQLVVNLFSSIGYFDDEEQNRAAVLGLGAAVAPGGWLVIDFMNAPKVRASLRPESQRDLADGRRARETRWISGAPPRVNKRVQLLHGETLEREYVESVRLYEPDELAGLMAQAGTPEVTRFGGYDGCPYTSETDRAILVGRRF